MDSQKKQMPGLAAIYGKVTPILGVVTLALLVLFFVVRNKAVIEFNNSEISKEQYYLIQDRASLSGADANKQIAEALSDNKITQAEYEVIKASQDEGAKAALIKQIKADVATQ